MFFFLNKIEILMNKYFSIINAMSSFEKNQELETLDLNFN